MKGSIGLIAVPALAGAAVVTTGAPAYAAPPRPAELRMTYGTPRLTADNAGVIWGWALTNAGPGAGEAVVATHKISPDQAIVGVSRPCVSTGGNVVCRFGEIKPGERRTGWIRTSVARPGPTLRVSAQVTWHEYLPAPGTPVGSPPSPAAGLGTPGTGAGNPAESPSGAGAAAPAPRDESWGVADTDVATDMPGQRG